MPKLSVSLPTIETYSAHKEKWKDCTRCPLHHGRDRVVLARGQVPADIVFVGEAPGVSENLLGRPFVGPAGKLLDQIVAKSIGIVNGIRLKEGLPELRCAFTNVVCCIPLGEDGRKVDPPEQEEINQCRPRLQEFFALCKPRLIVCVGDIASTQVSTHEDIYAAGKVPWLLGKMQFCDIDHPAYILRLPVQQKGLRIQKCVVNLVTSAEKLE